MNIQSLSAHALSKAIHLRQVSCREVMVATLNQISHFNPQYNAIVNLREETDLLVAADAHDSMLAKGVSKGWLHGIPQAIKDLANVESIPTTMGSPFLKDFMPLGSGLMAARMQSAGCIVIGKTNTPEFGLGSHTFNEVFGTTKNAFDKTKTAGGSSGGAAVALALNMLCVADGSDFMGSLRNPAGWNNVYGLRPSQGRVPMWPAADNFISQLPTEGPMARNVQDLALLLETQSGFDARVPLSLKEPFQWKAPVDSKKSGVSPPRIAWLGDLNGYLPTDPGILEICETGLKTMENFGSVVESVALGYSPEKVWQAWLVWRAALVAARLEPFTKTPATRALMKPEALWECDRSAGVKVADFSAASAVRSDFYQHLLKLFERYDFLALPTAQVWPFDIQSRWPKEIAGRAMDTYHRWMEVVIYATFAGLPAISLPLGFGTHGIGRGLPAGIQIIGKPQADLELLQFSATYEMAYG
jgi:amidase